MDFSVIASPSQLALINDLFFDLTGFVLNVSELAAASMTLIVIFMLIKSPLFTRE